MYNGNEEITVKRTSVERLLLNTLISTALVHVLKYDRVTVPNSMIPQRLFVVHKGSSVESDDDLASRYAALDFAEGLEILEFQIFADIENEYIVAQCGNCHFHSG